MKNRQAAFLITFALILLTEFSYSQGRNPIGSINTSNKRYTFILNPGETVHIKYSFHAWYWHTAFIREDGQGVKKFEHRTSKLQSRSGLGSGPPKDYTHERTNKTTKPILFEIDDNVTLPNESKWQPIHIRMEEERPNYAKITWKDHKDSGFGSAIAEVTITQP